MSQPGRSTTMTTCLWPHGSSFSSARPCALSPASARCGPILCTLCGRGPLRRDCDRLTVDGRALPLARAARSEIELERLRRASLN